MTDYAARIRAAHAYAGFDREAFASALGLSVRTVSRLETGESPSTVELRRQIAEVCGVPEWFMEHGFQGAVLDGAEPSVRDRVEALESKVGTLPDQHREVRELRAKLDQVDEDLRAVLRMASQWPTATPPGAQPPAPQASRSTGTTPERSGRQAEEASEPGTGR